MLFYQIIRLLPLRLKSYLFSSILLDMLESAGIEATRECIKCSLNTLESVAYNDAD